MGAAVGSYAIGLASRKEFKLINVDVTVINSMRFRRIADFILCLISIEILSRETFA